MADNTLVIQIDLEKGDTSDAFKDIAKGAKKSGRVVGTAFGTSFGSGFKQVLAANLGADAIKSAFRGIVSELGNVVSAGKELEVIETQFRTMLGSTKAAQKQLADLQQFAATTPFQLPGLATSTRQLLSFGVAQEQIIPTLQKLGDLAAGTGADISDLAIPFGRLVASQKLTLVELDKFADRGINLFQKFADSTGMSIGEVRDAVSKGKIPFSEFEKAIGSLTGEGGKFFNSMAAQSRTLSGVMSTLSDNLFNLRANLGKAFSPIIIAVVDKFTKMIQEFNKSVSELSLEDASKSFIDFNTSIIDYVIRPLELVTNVMGVVKDSMIAGFSAIVASVGVFAGAIGSLLELVGADGAMSQGLKNFAQTSNETFQQLSTDASNSINSIAETPIADKMAVMNEELALTLDETNAIVAEKSTIAKETIEGNLVQPVTTFTSIMGEAWKGLGTNVSDFAKSLKQTGKELVKILGTIAVKGFGNSFKAIGAAIASGADAGQAFLDSIKATFGEMASALGDFYIKRGIAGVAASEPGAGAVIAAGAALKVLSGVLGAGGGGTSGGAAGGVGGEAGAGVLTEEAELPGDADLRDTKATSVNITVEGSLVQQEELGAFLQDTINEANEKNGIVQVNPRFA